MPLDNLNIARLDKLDTPAQIKTELPLSEVAAASVSEGRAQVNAILNGSDPRLLVVIGPCSIHDLDAAREYARKLRTLQDEVSDSLLLVMRAYFEKPRTTVGWKGLVNDPDLDDSFQIGKGIRLARALLIELAELGLPLSTEALDPITPQYLQDLISWSAIGARTTESQTHREMASGLSCAVGFKNGTDGGLDVATNALQSVAKPHRFLGINHDGEVSVIHTRGNPNAHIVLRGGNGGPNFDADSVRACEAALNAAGSSGNIMIDCSHANSDKDYRRQVSVARDVADQIEGGNSTINGLMIESNLSAGNQKLTPGGKDLAYGVSITDGCIDWAESEALMRELHSRLGSVLRDRRDRSAVSL
ncbi:MAG: 3-deoxy-7-phosphoheptulonate synthase [Pseudomonadaceae bacterium]|nr:3-deoxy-7-phosphoheptulonate synthase [Pseudomonadaceae bacterium]